MKEKGAVMHFVRGFESYKDARTPRDDRALQDKAGSTEQSCAIVMHDMRGRISISHAVLCGEMVDFGGWGFWFLIGGRLPFGCGV